MVKNMVKWNEIYLFWDFFPFNPCGFSANMLIYKHRTKNNQWSSSLLNHRYINDMFKKRIKRANGEIRCVILKRTF